MFAKSAALIVFVVNVLELTTSKYFIILSTWLGLFYLRPCIIYLGQ